MESVLVPEGRKNNKKGGRDENLAPHGEMGTTGDLTATARVLDAHTPRDIFGDLSGTRDEQLRSARNTYKRLARATHPDVSDADGAHDAFTKLTTMWELAQDLILSDSYEHPGFAG